MLALRTLRLWPHVAARLRHGFEAPVLAHFDGDHGQFDAENARNEWAARASSILLKKRLVCSFVLVLAADPWLPRSTCPVALAW